MATFGAKVHAFQDPDELYVWAKKINVYQDALVQERLEYLYNIRVGSQDFPNESVARMYIMAENLNRAIIVPPCPLKDMQAKVALNTVTSVLNSNEGVTMSDNF